MIHLIAANRLSAHSWRHCFLAQKLKNLCLLAAQSLDFDVDGSVLLEFGEQSDPLAGRLKALLLHLHSREPQVAGGAAQMSPALEASRLFGGSSLARFKFEPLSQPQAS